LLRQKRAARAISREGQIRHSDGRCEQRACATQGPRRHRPQDCGVDRRTLGRIRKKTAGMQYLGIASVYYTMDASTTLDSAMADQDRNITAIISRERGRLRSFIRRRVSDPGDVEDILQDVFYELVEAARLLQPIEQVGAWLFRVARNRIIDRFRRKSAAPANQDGLPTAPQDEAPSLEELLPSPDSGPEARYARRLLLEELDAALEELPAVQREVFIAHELEGRSFRELARETGLSINTLLARKRYAVLHLRKRLQAIHDEFDTSEGWSK
jgi:RNA polymerase sigma factor (sigma-70 family)